MDTCSQLNQEWIECGKWLLRCLPELLSPLEPVLTSSQSSVLDLVSTLKDGVVLCHLILVLSQKEIAKQDLKQFRSVTLQSKFIFKTNISIFLNYCETFYGIDKKKLFTVEDLVNIEDAGNMSAIISTLSILSNCPKAKKTGIPGFAIKKVSSEAATRYYRDICDQLDIADANQDEPIYAMTDTVIEPRDEEIYESLVAPKQKMTGKQQCINELLTTEQKYVDTLKILVNLQNTLIEKSKYWKLEEIKDIFLYLPELLEIHSEMLDIFSSEIRADNFSEIANAFIQYKFKLLVYSNYCARLPSLQQRLEEEYKRENNTKLIELEYILQGMTPPNSNFRLCDYVSVPMQRILKYHLLIDSLIKYSKDDPEFVEQLRKAHNEITDVTNSVNEYKRDMEMMELIDSIEDTVENLELQVGIHLTDYGRLVCDGELRLADNPAKPKGSYKPVYCFLLDKICVICISSKSQTNTYYNFYLIRDAKTVTIEDINPNGKNKWTTGFSITNTPSENGKDVGLSQMAFIAKTKEDAYKWKQAFVTAMERTFPEQNCPARFFEYTTFPSHNTCSFCNLLLHGAFFQGYYCKKTNEIAHKHCLPPVPRERSLTGRLSSSASFERPLPSLPGQNLYYAVVGYIGNPVPPKGLQALCFSAGDYIFVKNTHGSWYEGSTPEGHTGFFPSSTVEISKQNDPIFNEPYYVGDMTRDQAKQELSYHADGTFLVRRNPETRDHAISLRYRGQQKQIKIYFSHSSNGFYIHEAQVCPSIPLLIQYYSQHNLTEAFKDIDCYLNKPIRLEPPPTRRRSSHAGNVYVP